jgi:hypothetical protein
MHFSAHVRSHKSNDPLCVDCAHHSARWRAPAAKPIEPEGAVWIDEDLDDVSVGESLSNERPHRSAQHAHAAVECRLISGAGECVLAH